LAPMMTLVTWASAASTRAPRAPFAVVRRRDRRRRASGRTRDRPVELRLAPPAPTCLLSRGRFAVKATGQ
jgi:hypothetical protein